MRVDVGAALALLNAELALIPPGDRLLADHAVTRLRNLAVELAAVRGAIAVARSFR